MTESEHFDIRTITPGIPLRDCSSRLAKTVCAHVYDKVRYVASPYALIAEEVTSPYGIHIANKRVSVTPATLTPDNHDTGNPSVGSGCTGCQYYVGGFSAMVERGLTRGDETYFEALSTSLASTTHVCASIKCGCTTAGMNSDAVVWPMSS